MGCKCGRDILFGENEIVKAEDIREHYNQRYKKKSMNNTYYIPNNNNNSINKTNNLIQYNNIRKPEINIKKKNTEEALSSMNASQRSSLNLSPPKKIKTPEFYKKIEYPQKIISLINEIRSNPFLYSKVVEDSIKYIKVIENNKIIYSNIVKVALHRGESAFREAINQLQNTEPMHTLRYNPQLLIPLPENEAELNEQNFLKEQINKIKQKKTNIEIYFKDLIKIPEVSVLLMIVDDNSKNNSKKRDTLLNKDLKFIGVNSKFIGKHFVAHLSFSS